MIPAFSVVIVCWYDPTMGYTRKYEVVEDADLVGDIGVKYFSTTSHSCVSRSQARQLADWMLALEKDGWRPFGNKEEDRL